MQIAYFYCYTLPYLPYLYNVGVPIEKKRPRRSKIQFEIVRNEENVPYELMTYCLI